ncbi:hypothetical protein F5887DRAFT_1143082 [Amanita rubescens]|nr:hypothetical protein F5887DRAFT_1143082 [Amanita rubescens]
MLESPGNTLGAPFIGVVVASTLLGVSLIQAWHYYTDQNDRWPLKTLVSAVIICEVVHQALITHTIYTYLVAYFREAAQIGNIVWSIIVCLLVQSFLTMRLWRLSNHNIWVTSIIVALVIAEFACIVVYAGLALSMETFLQVANLKRLSIAINALAAAGDVSIAAVLCTLLHKSRTGFHRSNTMINRLILFSVNTSLLTSLCALASLISIVVAGESFIYIAFFFCSGRLYTNSLLATLNAREMIRGAESFQSIGKDHSFSLRDTPKTTTIGSKGTGDISIRIDTTKATESDTNLASRDTRRSSLELGMNEKEGSINGEDYA